MIKKAENDDDLEELISNIVKRTIKELQKANVIPKSEYLTPPDLAKRLGVGVSKVLDFIKAGDLKVTNVARNGCERPRYRISPAQLRDFEERKAAKEAPANPQQRTRRRRRGKAATEESPYF